MELLQIVPRLPPSISGVGDYALLLARELATVYGVQTRFLCGDPAWQAQAQFTAPFAGEAIRERSTAAMSKALRASSCRTVLLHYVGHGYEKRGCPLWLVRAVEEWKSRGDARLIVLFHEVSGSGPIWTSGFWTSGLQSRLAFRLARTADGCRITTEVAANRLRVMLTGKAAVSIQTLAVFSTLGEPAVQLPYKERQSQMVVFGGSNWRKEAYTCYLPELKEACQRLQIDRVIDIGASSGIRPTLPIPFLETGVLPAAEVSRLMSHSKAGFFTYPVPHIGKSTIFAAYCAHGMTSVTFTANRVNGDANLRPDEHFLAGTSPPVPSEENLAAVAASANAWYRRHRLEIHARQIFENLQGSEEMPILPFVQNFRHVPKIL